VTDVEQVLVVPRDLALADGSWRGMLRSPLEPFLALVQTHGVLRPRPEMERDPSQKQVIPYLVLRDGPRWFLMRRTRAGADARLHERYSIGVGGHLNPGDKGVMDGLEREWLEEVEAAFVPDFRYVGLLNDDDTDIGSVHLGVVFEADAAGRPVAVRETEKLSGSFVAAPDVEAVRDRLETWSALVFDALRA
jgi:predicted NUDIX family phosphoesterase